MTISEAIGLVDNYRPNLYTNADKVKWLSMIDGMVYREIIDNHLTTNWKLLPLTLSSDYTESDVVSVHGIIADNALADTYVVYKDDPVHIISNAGNVLTLEGPITCQKWEKLLPYCVVGYHLLPETAYGSVELLVPDPYAEDIYINYLESRIDKENAEIAKYNVDISLFNQAYQAYADIYNRNNMPKRRVSHFRL